MKKMEELKFKYRPFEGEADVWTEETYDTALLCVCRKSGNEMVTGLFNFSNEDRTAWIDMGEFTWKDLFTGEKRVLRGVPVPAAVTHGITANGIEIPCEGKKSMICFVGYPAIQDVCNNGIDSRKQRKGGFAR